jgi:hypothetical protein
MIAMPISPDCHDGVQFSLPATDHVAEGGNFTADIGKANPCFDVNPSEYITGGGPQGRSDLVQIVDMKVVGDLFGAFDQFVIFF